MRSLCVTAPDLDSKRETSYRAVLLYEDTTTGVRGKRLTDSIIDSAGPVFTLNTARWNFSEVDIGSLSAFAADQAANAEIVVISMRNGSGLSSSLRLWINRWIMRRRGEHSSFIVLFDAPGPATDFARRHLQNAARRAGMDFFTQTGDIEEEQASVGDLLLAV